MLPATTAPPFARRRLDAFGAVAASLACLSALVYSVVQVLVVTVWGPPEWVEVAAIMAPSLALAVFFVPTLGAIHARAADDRKHLLLVSVAFGAMYAALVGFVYLTQLAVVAPGLRAGEAVDADLFRVAEGTLLTMADAIGYAFMSVAAGFAAFAFGGDRLGRWTRGALLAHGALAPFVALAAGLPSMVLLGMAWLVTGPLSLGLVAATFARDHRRDRAAQRADRALRRGKPSA